MIIRNMNESMGVHSKPAFQRKLRVLMLTWEFPPAIVGGLSAHVFGLSKQLVQMGIEVHVITAGAVKLPPAEEHNGIFVHRVNPLNEQDDYFLSWVGGLNMAIAFKTMELAKEIRFSIIHAHDWLVSAAAIVLKDELGIPLLTTMHSAEFGRNGGIYNEMQRFIHEKEKQLIERSEQIIVCSEFMKRELYSIFQRQDNVAVIPNGVDTEININAKKLNVFLSDQKKKMIFSIGRMVEEKGFQTIFEAAQLVKRRGINVYFIAAGKGPLLESYRRKVIEENLENHLAFIGHISDEEKAAYLAQSEITVFPSLYEPFGIVALESMIHGKPTIVSDTGGFKDIVKHKETGYLMVPGSAESLLEQINFILNHPKQAEKAGLQGRENVMNLYSWRRAAIETKRLIEALLVQRQF